jgi:hypothetical protein
VEGPHDSMWVGGRSQRRPKDLAPARGLSLGGRRVSPDRKMNIVERAVADALLITIRRIEAMPGSWHGLTEELDSTLRGRLAKHTDALNTFLALPNGHVEMRTVEIKATPYEVVRAVRGFEQGDDPYVVIIGRDRVAILLRRPQDAGHH